MPCAQGSGCALSEQGKETVRMDKVNQALAMFGMKAVPGKADDE